MADPKTDDRTLAERESDATDRFQELRADALEAQERLGELDADLTDVEGRVAELDDRAFDITVQQSGAMDLQSGPLGNDDDAMVGVMKIVHAETYELRSDLVDAVDDLVEVRHGVDALGEHLKTLDGDVDGLVVEVDAIRAEGGDIHPEPSDEDIEDQEWMQERMDEALHAE